MHRSLLALAATLTGCLADISASSRTYLGPEQSGAVSAHSADDTAREVARLFEIRDYAMVDQHINAPNGERVLKFTKGNRAFAAEKDDSQRVTANDVGSVFYVWVAPSPNGSTVSVLGKPTLAGVEPCTSDGVQLPCTPLRSNTEFATRYLTGHAEADIAHGILSELALEGYAIGPMPANAPTPSAVAPAVPKVDAQVAASQKQCKEQRAEILHQASAEKDPQERYKILQKAPTC
jgi:hypothetical protein